MLAKMLKIKWLAMSSRFRHSRKKTLFLFSFLGFLILPIYVFMNFYPIFQAWMQDNQLGVDAVLQFSTASLSGMFFMLFFTGIPAALHYLYLSPDNDLFTPLPISHKTLFQYNVLQVVIHNVGLFVGFALPILSAAAAAIELNFYSICALLFSVLFIFLPSLFAVLFSGILARFFPIKNSRFFASLLMGLAFLLFWGVIQFVRFSKVNPNSMEFSWKAMEGFYAFASTFVVGVNPGLWVSEMVIAAGLGQLLNAFLWMVLLFSASAIAFLFIIPFHRCFAVRYFKVATRKIKVKMSASLLSMLLKHELVSKARDPRLLQSTLMLNAIMIIFAYSNAATLTSGNFLSDYLSVVLFGAMGISMQSRTNLAFDGLSFQYKLFTPLPLNKLLAAKLLHMNVLMLPGIIISAFIITQKYLYSFQQGCLAIVTICILLFGMASLNVLLSTFSINFNWNDFRELVGTNARYMSMFISLIWGVTAVVWLVLIPKQVIAFIIYFLYVWVCILIFTHYTVLRLKNIQWNY